MPITCKYLFTLRGEAEYQVDGERVIARHRAFRDPSRNEDEYEREILPRVGTVYLPAKPDEFPSPEVLALFPGFVGSRDNPTTRRIECTATPHVTIDFLGPVVCLDAIHLAVERTRDPRDKP